MKRTTTSQLLTQISRKENNEMKTKNVARTVTLFVALTIAGVALVVFGQDSAFSAIRNTLPLLGAAMFASGLTFFMVDLTR